jgi:hypothetical protein
MKHTDYFSAIQDRGTKDGLLFEDSMFRVERINGQIVVTGIGKINNPFIYA